MSLILNGTDQYAKVATSGPTGHYLFTAWAKRAGDGYVMTLGQDGTFNQQQASLQANGSDRVGAMTWNTSGQWALSANNAWPTGSSWTLAAGFWSGSGLRRCFLGGTHQGTNSVAKATGAADVLYFGCRPDLTQFFPASLSHLAIWNVPDFNFPTSEALLSQLLTKDPQDPAVTGGTLLNLWRFRGDYQDSVGGLHLTPFSSPTFDSDAPSHLLDGGSPIDGGLAGGGSVLLGEGRLVA